MSEPGGAGRPEAQARCQLERIYVKDLSFESPRSPDCFRGNQETAVTLDLNSRHQALESDLFEVVLTVTITGKHEARTVFIVEIEQAGLFRIAALTAPELERVLATFCPNVLLPYARETIDSLMLKGGFPPLLLAPVNFDALYHEVKRRQDAGPPDEPIRH